MLGEKVGHTHFSIDEALFTHNTKREQIWVLGWINNVTKDFRLEVTKNRTREILKNFLNKYIDSGNKIITDGWVGYVFINSLEGYEWETHNHGEGDFGMRNSSTSHIESLCHQLKSKIKHIYNSNPVFNFLYYLREAEWMIKYPTLNSDQKINEFFSSFVWCQNTSDVEKVDYGFMVGPDFKKENLI